MKLGKLVFALFAVVLLSCSKEDLSDKGNQQEVDEITKALVESDAVADVVAKALVGKWQLVREGDRDFSASGTYLEFDANKNVVCEFGVGTESYQKNSYTVEFEDDWTAVVNKVQGHLKFPLNEAENRFICSFDGGQLVLLPDCGLIYFMDPTKYFVKVK